MVDRTFHPDAFGELVRSRRTTKLLDPETTIDSAIIEELCALATWAPNHKRTEPWRFAVFTGQSRRVLGETIADELALEGTHEAKVAKTRTKYLRAPTVIVVGSMDGPDPVTTGENRDAVAAGISNLLLGAHARGLATLWSSVATPRSPALWRLCDFPDDTFAVGAIYLGYPTGSEPLGKRSVPMITWVD